MYVGKNNFQNEELTFKFAVGNDWWFHAKGCPGSHVIVKTNGEELPDRTFEEAARLAAHYSQNKEADKVEIDYVEKKHVKKVAGAKPGFVIYHTNYSMVIGTDISDIQQISLRIFAFGKRKEKEMSVVSAKDKHGTSGWGGVS